MAAQSMIPRIAEPHNEPVLGYAPGSVERTRLQQSLASLSQRQTEVPLYIDGRWHPTGRLAPIRAPHRHHTPVGHYHQGGRAETEAAIAAAQKAAPAWAAMPWEQRAAIFLRAAELLAGPFRDRLNATTMLGQSKTCHQAEIDAACELVDFWRFNVYYLRRLLQSEQPLSVNGIWNQVDLRPLEGFVFAVSPFNFTSIAANLATAPVLMGNTVVWKPADNSMLSACAIVELLIAAGLPPGVVNMVVGPPAEIGEVALHHPALAGVHFTGSTRVFQHMWRTVGERIDRYRTYPRLVGETGGKDFILAHESADEDALVAAILRGGYEYQGQKCSAASRVYLPTSIAQRVLDRVAAEVTAMKVGDVADFSNFMGAVIDQAAFQRITGYIRLADGHAARVIAGGQSDDREGYFIRPTLIQTSDPRHRLMSEEIFGPVVTVTTYDRYDDVLALIDSTSPYALTGAIFSQDRYALLTAQDRLRQSAGNLYINDKPTGAVVGQQPFGGARASGTNDKAGSPSHLLRWVSMRTIKENLIPPRDYRYPFLAND